MGISASKEDQLQIHDAVFQISCRFDEKFWALVQRRLMDKLHNKLCLTYEEFILLISSFDTNNPQDQSTIEYYAYYAFEAFRANKSGKIDCMQTLATLILVSYLDLSLKQQYIFSLYNISKYRQGQLSPDEALFLFRSVAHGALKVLISIEDPSRRSLSSTATLGVAQISSSFFENLTKTIFEDKETISLEHFKQACQENDAIVALLHKIDQARGSSLQKLYTPVQYETQHDPSEGYVTEYQEVQDGSNSLENKEPQEQAEASYGLEYTQDTTYPSSWYSES